MHYQPNALKEKLELVKEIQHQTSEMTPILFYNHISGLGWVFPSRTEQSWKRMNIFFVIQWNWGRKKPLSARYWSHKASMERQRWRFTEQQNTSRMEPHGMSDELLSVWGIMGHHNLQQIFKGHWNRNWTSHSYCNTVLQWFAVCTLWITNTFNFSLWIIFLFFIFYNCSPVYIQ